MAKKLINGFFSFDRRASEEGQRSDWNGIPLTCLTHLTWAFFIPRGDGSIEIPPKQILEDILRPLVSKAHAGGIKILASIGGWGGSHGFPAIAGNPQSIRRFVDECMNLLEKFHFDGIDIDWEYPGYPPHNGTYSDSENCVLLASELRAALKRAGKELTFCIPGRPIEGIISSSPTGFKIVEMEPFVDRFNVMGYDFFVGSGISGTAWWHNSALRDDGSPNRWSAGRAIAYYRDSGLPAEKIQLGLSFYSRGYRNCGGLGVPYHGLGGYRGCGVWTFGQIKRLESSSGLEKGWCEMGQVPMATQSAYHQVPIAFRGGKEWISYEDERSLALKCETVKSSGLAGVSIWSVAFDDADSGYPLTTSIAQALSSPQVESPVQSG